MEARCIEEIGAELNERLRRLRQALESRMLVSGGDSELFECEVRQ